MQNPLKSFSPPEFVLASLCVACTSLADISDGLVAYYPFNGDAADMSGGGHHGVVTGATLTTNRLRESESAYLFDGIDDWIDIGNSVLETNDTAHELTLAAWIYPLNVADNRWVLSQYMNPGSGRFVWRLDGGKIRYFRGGSDVSSQTTLVPNVWYHIATTKDADGTITFYLNGTINGTGALQGAFAQTDTRIGGGIYNGGINYLFHGSIDEVRIYDRVLSPAEIAELNQPASLAPVEVKIDRGIYFAETSLTGHSYRLVGRDTPLTNEWYDLYGPVAGTGGLIYGYERGTNVAWLPSHAWEITEITDGSSLLFDGTNDFAYVGHDAALNLSSGLTLEAWVKPSSGGSDGTVMAKALSDSVSCYRLGLDSSDQARFRLSDSGGLNFADLTSAAPVPSGEWSHVAATYDGATATLYVDGYANTNTPATGSVRVNATSPFVIGSIFGFEPFSGLLDEVRLWDHARTPSEILANYNTKLSGSPAGLVAYWQLAETNGQSAADTGPNALDLTLGDTSSADSTDPTWFAESFPGYSEYQMIWEFGRPCIAVYWDSLVGGVYQVQTNENLEAGAWGAMDPIRAGTAETLEYFEIPQDSPRSFRLIGQLPTNSLAYGLTAYYPFDGDAADMSGGGHHGVVTGATLTTNRFRDAESAYAFDGIDDWIDIGNSVLETNDTAHELTLAAWIYPLNVADNRWVLSQYINSGSGRFVWRLDGGKIRYFRGGSDVFSQTTLVPNVWYHIAVTKKADGAIAFFLNGVVDGTGTLQGAFAQTDTRIGGGIYNGGINYLYHGLIDDLRLYDRPLSAQEIHLLWQSQ